MRLISWCTIFLFSLNSFASGKPRGLQEAQQTLNKEFNAPGKKISSTLTKQAMQYYVIRTIKMLGDLANKRKV